ncbi:membrane protein insertase YidC [Geobacter sp. OR-1]|uniref:membrane protein insertase YidC n=1 Tax=Geobacter sp. OR-1 TaxID=1266765 RepID=UPI00054445C6|nr:membrane protein insertase YidC [Geobacter sp. OR-1]GAM08500.1 membrane protein insertase YidC [Geobacter sp. OR-1]
MEKRVLIAVLLSIAVMYGFSFLFPPPPAKVAKTTAVQGSTSSSRNTVTTQAETVVKPDLTKGALPVAQEERDISVETDLYRAVFTSKGGAIKKLTLKSYRETTRPGSPEIALIDGSSNRTLTTSGDGFLIDPNAQFATSAPAVIKASGAEKKELEFVWTSNQGVVLRKVYSFSGNDYGIQLVQQLSSVGAVQQAGTLRLTLANKVITGSKEGRYEVYGPVTLADDKVSTVPVADLAKGAKAYDKQIIWTGFADKYFLNSVIAKDASIASVKINQLNPSQVESVISSPQIVLKPGESVAAAYRIYFGPKDLEVLKAQGSRLEEVIDFGWFSAIAKPLLITIKFFKKYVGNYGLAIIIITIILKILFYPLTHTSYKSMKEMQKLQPKMQELKEKFKNDKDGMNRAVMELYKAHKVNPLGGCLPMVVQIPVFFALYKALMFSIELRHAPFYFWIQDLSAKDPYYVTPLVMGVTMFIQQKMTPTNMDPVQAKMMLMLPVVFTFMFLNFPSGLVLYWLVNNILTIAQQSYINRTVK